jgi:hypothetical protein
VYIDKTGKQAFGRQFMCADSFSEGFAGVVELGSVARADEHALGGIPRHGAAQMRTLAIQRQKAAVLQPHQIEGPSLKGVTEPLGNRNLPQVMTLPNCPRPHAARTEARWRSMATNPPNAPNAIAKPWREIFLLISHVVNPYNHRGTVTE